MRTARSPLARHPKRRSGRVIKKGAKAPIGSEPLQGLDCEAIDEPAPDADRLAVRSRSACQPFAAVVRMKLEQGGNAVRIYQDLVAEHGYTCSYDSVWRFTRQLCRTREMPFRRIEVEPGFEMQVD